MIKYKIFYMQERAHFFNSESSCESFFILKEFTEKSFDSFGSAFDFLNEQFKEDIEQRKIEGYKIDDIECTIIPVITNKQQETP